MGVGLSVILNRGGSLQPRGRTALSSARARGSSRAHNLRWKCTILEPSTYMRRQQNAARLSSRSCFFLLRTRICVNSERQRGYGCHPDVQHLPGAPDRARHGILLRSAVSGGVLAAGKTERVSVDGWMGGHPCWQLSVNARLSKLSILSEQHGLVYFILSSFSSFFHNFMDQSFLVTWKNKQKELSAKMKQK